MAREDRQLTPLGEKLRTLRKQRRMTTLELQAKSGVSNALISRYERDKANPKIATIKKLADALGVPISMLSGYPLDNAALKFVDLSAEMYTIPIYRRGIKLNAFLTAPNKCVGEMITLSSASCPDRDAGAIRHYGDHMIPEILDGDVAVFSRAYEVHENNLVVVYLEGELTVRRVRFLADNQIALMCTNPKYKPLIIPRKNVPVLVKVIKLLRDTI